MRAEAQFVRGPGPAVAISGPTEVDPGSTHTYVLRIVGGGETAGGLDVSADGLEIGPGGDLNVKLRLGKCL